MKRKFSFYVIIVKILVLTFFFIPKSFSEDLGEDLCENFRQELLQNSAKYRLSFYPSPASTYYDLGFEINVVWTEDESRYVVDRSKENYLIVGRFLRQSTIGKVTPEMKLFQLMVYLLTMKILLKSPF